MSTKLNKWNYRVSPRPDGYLELKASRVLNTIDVMPFKLEDLPSNPYDRLMFVIDKVTNTPSKNSVSSPESNYPIFRSYNFVEATHVAEVIIKEIEKLPKPTGPKSTTVTMYPSGRTFEVSHNAKS